MNSLSRPSTALIVSGALAAIFGAIASLWPISTALTLVIVWGVYALIDGVMALVLAFRPVADRSRGILVLTGVLGILAGLVAVLHPVSSGTSLVWVLGVWLLVRGVLEIISAFAHDTRRRVLLALGGLLWIIAGLVLTTHPGAAAVAFSLWIGLAAIVWGLLLVGAGIVTRAAERRSTSKDATA